MMQKYYNLSAKIGIDYCYNSAAEVLAHMDRLGVYTTVMEYGNGSNSLHLNRNLLQQIKDLPRDRVIPGYFLDVGAAYQLGALEKIRQMMIDRPGCIVLEPKDRKYRLRAIDQVLDQVQDVSTVVLMNAVQFKENGGADDLEYLAKRYPKLSFVIRRVMYSSMPFALDCLRRAENVYLDTSWLHTRNALAMLSRHFGADRLIFSLGPKGNHGAPMAALTFAPLSEEEKDKIRFGNFQRLFGKELTQPMPNKVQNSFWTSFVEEGIVPDVPIYDIHTHMGPTGSDWYLENCEFDTQIQAFEEDMERYHIRKIVSSCSGRPDLLPANEDLAAAVGEKTDRFKGYVRYSPHYGEKYTEEYMAKQFAGDYFVGLKTLPQYMQLDIRDEKYYPLFRYAHEHKLPVLLHCWGGGFGTPRKCAEAAAKWPDAKVILGHSGGNTAGKKESLEIANDPAYSNVYFEFCGSFPADFGWKEMLEVIDYRRVLFGTDACLHDIGWELGRLLSEDIPDEQLIAILGGNAQRLFGFVD